MKKVILYTDGACSENPGVGGWAFVLQYKNVQKKVAGGELLTTNNRMELKAVIEGLKALKEGCEVEVYSDSAYVVNAFQNNWIISWQLNNWKNSQKKEVLNRDLWEELLDLISKHKVVIGAKISSDRDIYKEFYSLVGAKIISNYYFKQSATYGIKAK